MNFHIRFTTIFTVSLLLVSFVTISIAEELSQPIYDVIEELDIKVVMRDGVRLSTNIYRPDAEGNFPVLLKRTPYGNGGTGNKDSHFWAERGYVTVVQDTRGRYESEGVFYPIFNEAEDGLDTQKWCSEQPWCNGKIGTYGGSYHGMTQWMPALEGSNYVSAMFPYIPYIDCYTVHFQNGAARLRLFSFWYTFMTAPYDYNMNDFWADVIDIADTHLPLAEQDTVIGWRMPFTRDWLSHPERDAYWEPLRIQGKYHNVKAPVYILAGWYDLFTAQNLNSFMAMRDSSIPEYVRKNQKIIVGPWGHGSDPKTTLGDLDFGEDAGVNINDLMLRWFDHHLKGINTGIMDEPPVKIFVMGDNVWRYENEWPLARTKYTKFYLHSDGNANTKSEDGSLSMNKADNEPPDRYSYNPADPVPSAPDSSVFDDFKHFPIDHSGIEGRNDILVYTTEPLKSDLEVTGPVSMTLYASSSAKTTDFTGKFLDVYPDGRAIYICDGIIRVTHRNGDTGISYIEPGKIYEYTIDLWATSNVFKKGHCIRVEISSSNFPRFDRNLNTALNNALATEMVTAEQAIYHDKDHPSCIVLPLIPR